MLSSEWCLQIQLIDMALTRRGMLQGIPRITLPAIRGSGLTDPVAERPEALAEGLHRLFI